MYPKSRTLERSNTHQNPKPKPKTKTPEAEPSRPRSPNHAALAATPLPPPGPGRYCRGDVPRLRGRPGAHRVVLRLSPEPPPAAEVVPDAAGRCVPRPGRGDASRRAASSAHDARPPPSSPLLTAGVDRYKDVEVNFISGRKAVLTIFEDGKEREKVTLSDYNDKGAWRLESPCRQCTCV